MAEPRWGTTGWSNNLLLGLIAVAVGAAVVALAMRVTGWGLLGLAGIPCGALLVLSFARVGYMSKPLTKAISVPLIAAVVLFGASRHGDAFDLALASVVLGAFPTRLAVQHWRRRDTDEPSLVA